MINARELPEPSKVYAGKNGYLFAVNNYITPPAGGLPKKVVVWEAHTNEASTYLFDEFCDKFMPLLSSTAIEVFDLTASLARPIAALTALKAIMAMDEDLNDLRVLCENGLEDLSNLTKVRNAKFFPRQRLHSDAASYPKREIRGKQPWRR